MNKYDKIRNFESPRRSQRLRRTEQASFGGRAEINVIFEIQHTTAKEITNLADGVKYSVPPMPAPEILIKAGSNFTVTAPPVFDNTLQKWIIKVTQTQ